MLNLNLIMTVRNPMTKQITFLDYYKAVEENVKNDLYLVLFVISPGCSSCSGFVDVIQNEFDTHLFSQTSFFMMDADKEKSLAFLPCAVPSYFIHHQGVKIAEEINLPINNRGRFSAPAIEHKIKTVIEYRKAFLS